MKSKQEVIQEAYDNTFPDSSNYSFDKIRSAVDENGWYRFNNDLTINICTTGFDYDKGAYRPQSLRGIENNLGWIKGLPPESMGECWVMTKDMGITIGNTEYMKEDYNRWIENVTHYQPIIKPEAPIY